MEYETQLRWVERPCVVNGLNKMERVFQYRTAYMPFMGPREFTDWTDVPVVMEADQ